MAISCGRYCSTTVSTPRKISHSRAANSPCPVRMTPLATYVKRGPVASTTPNPVHCEPGSIPSTRMVALLGVGIDMPRMIPAMETTATTRTVSTRLNEGLAALHELDLPPAAQAVRDRSEEHTSELQSL